MKFDNKFLLYSYTSLLYLLLGFIHYYNFVTYSLSEWIVISLLAVIAIVFDWQAIVLPSGEDLSLISPLLFTTAVIFGITPVIYIVLLLALVWLINKPQSWAIILFNSVQYALSAFVGLSIYSSVSAAFSNSQLTEVLAFTGFIVFYFITNVTLVGLYLLIRNGVTPRETLNMFLDYRSVLVYFTIMIMGILMIEVVQIHGPYGVILFGIVLAGLGTSYKGYYKLLDHFRSLANKDELTGLYNHRYFHEHLQEFINNKTSLSLMLIDIDHFKLYNEMYGHPQGDQLLLHVSKLITNHLPESALCCRYGGDQFGVAVLDKDEMPDAALGLAEQIRLAIVDQDFYGMEHMPKQRITVSIGLASYPEMAHNKEHLVMLADEALYKVKYTSRNKVQLYSSVIDELKGSFQFGKEEESLINTMKTFLTIINSKDRYTYSHTERNMEYAEALARKIQLPEEQINYLRYGALLHDIGKIEVPTEILNKRTRLDNQEWEIMKNHAIWGEQIVKQIKELQPSLSAIRHHHERYDGLGYPDGLAGENIPLSARILTICDSFDAMTTNRPYQKTKTVSEALEELSRCSGTQFDPLLVKAFIEVTHELRSEEFSKGA